jgi:hypothetical protein
MIASANASATRFCDGGAVRKLNIKELPFRLHR